MKKLLVFLLLLATISFAKGVEAQLITAEFDKTGDAHVVEEYTVSFANSGEISDFNALAGVNELSAWKAFLSSIEPAFFGNKTQLQIVSKMDSLGFGRVLLDYYLPNFASLAEESGRFAKRSISPNKITFYNSETKTLAIPSKVTVQLQAILPKAELFDVDKYVTTFPKALFLGPYVDQKAGKVTYIMRGPISASDFAFSYMIEKGIGEWNAQNIIDTAYNWAFTNPIYTLVILIIIVLAAIYREEIAGLVTDSFSGEEDIELPKKEL